MPTLRAALTVSCALAMLTLVQREATVLGQGGSDPFAFFQPGVIVSLGDRQRLDRGEVLVRVLPAREGQLAVFAASRLTAEPEALVKWTRAIEAMKKGPFVIAIRRFSDPPVRSDLDNLVLDDVDVESLRRCRRGECGVKLAEHEIQSVRMAAATAGADWKSAIQHEFRRVLFDRITRYRQEGLAGLPPNVDHSEPTRSRDVFDALLQRSPYLLNQLPEVADGLRRYPKATLPSSESFLYWSKEHYGRGKPVITVTQVHILRPGGPPRPMVLVLAQEVFASHYRTGSLGLTAIVAGSDDARYLVHLNRSRLDMLGGLFGGIARSLIEGRLANEAKPAMATVKGRLESGEPPREAP